MGATYMGYPGYEGGRPSRGNWKDGRPRPALGSLIFGSKGGWEGLSRPHSEAEADSGQGGVHL